MKIQDCELISPKDVDSIQSMLREIKDIAARQEALLGDISNSGAKSIWSLANKISWILSPKQ